jgi:hypothetical protein
VLLLWRGSPDAARALHDALPILKKAATIEIAEDDSPYDHDDLLVLSPIQHLRNHGAPAIPCKRGQAHERIVDLLEGKAFDLVVLGAGSMQPKPGCTSTDQYAQLLQQCQTALFVSA